MRKSLLGTIAGAALIAGGGLAAAQQRMDDSPGASGAKGSSQRELSGAAHERQPGAMQGQTQSGAVEEMEHRSGQSGEIQGPTRKRSDAIEEKEQRSGQTGEMQGQTRKRTGAIEEKERRSGQTGEMQGQTQGRTGAMERSGHPGAMQGQTQGRSDAVEDKEHRTGQSGAMERPAQGRSGEMQGPAQGRAATEQNTGVAEKRSAASVNLSPDQRTKLDETVTGGNLRRANHVDFALSAGTRIPRGIGIYPIPESIVEIVPQYRGFDYIVAEDELVIVDPHTRNIVAVQSADQGRSEHRGRVSEQRSIGSATLTSDQKTRLHGIITGGDVRRMDDVDFALSVGTHVPNPVTLYDVPESIVDIVPQYRGFEYIVVGDELVIVDPDTLDIVAVLPV